MKNLLLVPAVLMLLTMALAAQTNYPPLKDGLWSTQTQTVTQPGNVKDQGSYSFCRSSAYDESVRAKAKEKQKNCASYNEHVSGTTITTEGECKVASTTVKISSKATILGETAAHSESHTTYTPPLGNVSESTMIMDQKYVGPCPSGMQPGDRMMKDGSIQHLHQVTGQ